jgi:hypothetical protein
MKCTWALLRDANSASPQGNGPIVSVDHDGRRFYIGATTPEQGHEKNPDRVPDPVYELVRLGARTASSSVSSPPLCHTRRSILVPGRAWPKAQWLFLIPSRS